MEDFGGSICMHMGDVSASRRPESHPQRRAEPVHMI